MESESGMAGHVGKEARDKVWASVRTYEGANKRGALGSGLQALPGDAQLTKVGSQAVKACAVGSARGLHSAYTSLLED